MRVAAWLFAAFCLIYLGTAKGVIEHVDDAAMLRVTESLVESASLAVPPDTPGAMLGQDGRWYTRYGIGQSLLAVPFYVFGRLAPEIDPVTQPFDPHGLVIVSPTAFAVTLIGLLSTAASVALVYLTCRALDLRHVGALAAALAFGLGTFAWHYSRTVMSEPPSMLAATLAFYALVRHSNERRVGWAFISGCACAALLLLRIGNAVLLPPLALWLLFGARQSTRRLQRVAAWLAPILVVAAVLATLNGMRFGSPFETGYADQVQAFTTPIAVGVYGLLFSSGKGLFVYAPILAAGVLGWVALARRQPVAACIAALLVAAYVAFYARFDWWYGGGPWGPRFLVVILPLVSLGVGALVDTRPSTAVAVVLAGLAPGSVAVQVLSLAVPYLPYEAHTVQDPTAYERLLWHPTASPIVVHARSLIRHDYPLDLAFTYYPWPWLAWLQLGALTGGFGLLLAGAWRAVLPRRRRLPRSAALPA